MDEQQHNKEQLYSLIPLGDFKVLSGVDDREDKICRFCLVTSTLAIEQFCKRRFLRKKHNETFPFYGDLLLPLMEYPVNSISAVFAFSSTNETGEPIEKDFYSLIPISRNHMIPCNLYISPALERYRRFRVIKVEYWAGYTAGNVPHDLAAACMELAMWNMGRYKGRRVGMTGNVRGSGRDAEHFELSMPENVQSLLEPYKRRVI